MPLCQRGTSEHMHPKPEELNDIIQVKESCYCNNPYVVPLCDCENPDNPLLTRFHCVGCGSVFRKP